MSQWLKCLFGFHDTDPKSVIIEMGAVFHADLCHVCLQPVIGEFICNSWDEAQTVTNADGSQTLKGVNPEFTSGNYTYLGDEDTLNQLARLARGKRKLA